MRTSFRQILPQTALKILAGRKPACGFLPTLQQNYARKSAHISYEDRFLLLKNAAGAHGFARLDPPETCDVVLPVLVSVLPQHGEIDLVVLRVGYAVVYRHPFAHSAGVVEHCFGAVLKEAIFIKHLWSAETWVIACVCHVYIGVGPILVGSDCYGKAVDIIAFGYSLVFRL